MRSLDHVDQLQVMDDVGAVGDRGAATATPATRLAETSRATTHRERAERPAGASLRRQAARHGDERQTRPPAAAASARAWTAMTGRPIASSGSRRPSPPTHAADERGDEGFWSDAPGVAGTGGSALVADGRGLPGGAAAISPMTRAPVSPAAASAAISPSASAGGDGENQADAHVERAQHVFAAAPHPRAGATERAAARPTIPIRTTASVPVGQHARQVVGDAAAGDVRHALDRRRRSSSGRIDRQVDRCGASSASPTVAPSSGTRSWTPSPRRSNTIAPRERVAVRVQAGRRQADQHVAGAMRAAVDQPVALDAPTMKPATSYSPSA